MYFDMGKNIWNEAKDYIWITIGLLLYTLRLDGFPAALSYRYWRSDGSVGNHLLCHTNSYLLQLLHHKLDSAPRSLEDSWSEVYD